MSAQKSGRKTFNKTEAIDGRASGGVLVIVKKTIQYQSWTNTFK